MKVGEYILHTELGKGSSAIIYLAENAKREQFAIKKIKLPNYSHNILQLLNTEIDIISQIQNSSIVRYIEVLRTTNNIYIVMDLCAGGDLNTYLLYHNFIPYALVSKWLRKLLQTLMDMHSKNIAHRDIKPANLLLTDPDIEQADIKLGDFGVAKLLTNSMMQSFIGTPLYMAPEVLSNCSYDYKADIWSLGVVIYELLYGVPPFQCFKLEQLRSLHRKEIEFPHNSNVPDDAVQIIRAMLRINCNERPGYEDLMGFEFAREDYGRNREVLGRVLEVENLEIENLEVARRDSAIFGEKEIQGILLDFDKRKNNLMQILNLKEFYLGNSEMIYIVLRYVYLHYNELIQDMHAVENTYKNQEILINHLQTQITEILEIVNMIATYLENIIINKAHSLTEEKLCNILKGECQKFMNNIDQDSTAYLTYFSIIGISYFPNESYFLTLFQYASSFQIHTT